MKRITTGIALALLALGAYTAHAEDQASYDVKAAFAQTDHNKDGAIEVDEYFDRLVDTFFLGDTDKDGFLTEEEFVKVVVVKEDFAQVDKSGDGKLTRQEYVSARLPHFIALDTDKSGNLSLAEVEAALKGGND
jgi:Ca2+-binding EF-hand superfamily protein